MSKLNRKVSPMFMLLVMAIPMFVLAIQATVLASPTITVYPNDRPGWESAVGVYDEEFFTDATLNPGVSVVSDYPGYVNTSKGVWWDRLICPNETGGPTTTTWQFATPINAYGANWNPGVPGGPGASIEVAIDGSWVIVGEIPNSYTGEFWGFVSSEPFSSVRLSSGSTSGWCETYEMDNMTYGGATHDVAILDVLPSTNRTYVGCVYALEINVTVTNEGEAPENCTVNLYADNNTTTIGDEVTVGTQLVTNLTVGENRTLTFIWDTTGVTPCHNYTITAEATPVPGETDTVDNTMSSPTLVKVKLMGDINGDGKVDITDIVLLTKAFGSYPSHVRWNPDADICSDGKVDIKDLVRLMKNFGKAC